MSVCGAEVTPREAEVLQAIGQHLTNAQIAARLYLSVRTVESHVSSLLRKLGAVDRRDLAELAPGVAESADGRLVGFEPSWTSFVGRGAERDDVVAALRESRLVTLLGPGGVGKTRLAGVVAEQLAPRLLSGAAFVGLVSVRPGFLVQAVASVLGVVERPGQPLVDWVLNRLRRGHSLLVLDNCEHLVDDAAGFLAALLGAPGDVTVLATSRQRIGIAGERVIPLPGLSLDERTDGSAGSDAVGMFFERARAVDAQFEADPSVVRELCAELDGMPLAIELAAARTATLGVDGLRAGLSDRLRLLSGGRGGDQRHRSLRAVIDWSHELLDDEERAALRRLAVFAGGFDLGAAGAVVGLPVGAMADLVGRLADKSLLVRRDSALGNRWALLETVRAYAVEKMAAAGEQDELRGNHLRWAVGLAADLEARLDSGGDWQAEFDLVVDDLRAALSVAVDHVLAHRLAGALGHLAYARRFLAEAREHYRTAAEHAADDATAARDLRVAADVAQNESRGELRFELGVEAANRAATAGDRATQAAALAESVSIASRFPAMFESDVPLPRLRELLAVARRAAPDGDPVVTAQLAAARAWTETRTVDVPDIDSFDAALEAARRTDDPVLISAILDAACGVRTMHGRFRATYELSLERLKLLDRLARHDPHAGAEIHDVLHMGIENAVTAGELPAALDTFALFEADGMVAAAGHMVASKPVTPLALMGRFDEAIRWGRETRTAWEQVGCPPARWLAPPIYAVALCFGLRGQAEECDAWRALARDRVAGTQTRNIHFQLHAMATFADARVALHRGDLDEATRLIADVPTEPDAWWAQRHRYFDAYLWALTAEVAVVAGRPDAERRIAAAQPAAEQNAWAAACLARARGRRTGSPAYFADSLTGWVRIGARFERACTLLLMDGRAAEGEAELRALGCPAT